MNIHDIISIAVFIFYVILLSFFLIKFRKERKLMQEASNAVTTGLQLMEEHVVSETIRMEKENQIIDELTAKIEEMKTGKPAGL